MKNSTVSSFVTLEDNLLSLFFSGTYLTNYDFVEISKKMDFDIPLKSREVTLKTLIKESKDSNRVDELKNELLNLIDSRIDEYTKLSNSYENTSIVIKDWIQKANTLKSNVKEKLN